jgi:SSS family solute:Na+ symporter
VIGLAALDGIVMAAYGAVVLGIGWWANRRQASTEDYFLGGRRLRWWAVGVSLIATSFSSVSLIGGTGFGYTVGMTWLQLQIGDLIAIVVVALVFLPRFSRMRLTTAYEYLEERFGVVARTTASALFLIQTLLRASILVYAPAVALATVLDWSVPGAILVCSAAAVVYSAFGGISAVVWTDLIQMAVILFAVVYAMTLVCNDVPGGFDTVVDEARGLGRTRIVTVSASTNTPYNLLGACIPYAVLAISLFGTGQQAVQRFLSCRDETAARRAAITGWAVGTVALGATLFLGACLAIWASHHHRPLDVDGADAVLPAFLRTRLPAGFAGLVLAAILASSMSSLDSAIHSMSTAVIVDFRRRFARRAPGAAAELRVARLTTVACGVLATIGALYAAQRGEALLNLLIGWLGYFAGPLLGLFLLGMLTRRVREAEAMAGVVAALAAVTWLVVFPPEGLFHDVHRLWLAPFSCAVTVGVALAVFGFRSRLGGRVPAPPSTEA